MIKFIVIGLALIISGCELPEDDDGEHGNFRNDVDPVRVQYVNGNDGAEYSISQYECVDDVALVYVESKGVELYRRDRSCAEGLRDYIMDGLQIKTYSIDGSDNIVTLKVKAKTGGQLCSVGDILITFRGDLHEQITLTGIVSCSPNLVYMTIPNGEYWGRVEFFGYLDEYKEAQFRVSPHTVEI